MKHLFLITTLLFSVIAYSQVKDNSNTSIRIPAEPSKKEIDSQLIKVKVQPKFEVEKEKSAIKNYSSKKESKPFSMVYDDGLKNPGEIFEKRWRKEAVKGGIIKTMSDQYLGEHNVDTKFVNIVCRDHEYPDGDRVQIRINDVVIKNSLLLTSQYRRVEVDLIDGRNVVEIVALNQGESGPNTAEFVVYDDKGRVISSKEWNLLTGVKARIVFNNEKTIIKPKSESEENDKKTASN